MDFAALTEKLVSKDISIWLAVHQERRVVRIIG